MACRPNRHCVLFALIFAFARAQISGGLTERVLEECTQKCEAQNRTDDGHADLGCGSECAMEQCSNGCKMWRSALVSNCTEVCNITTDVILQKDLYCVAACNEAVNIHYQIVKENIGIPPAPALVPDSLKSTSLDLVWEGSRHSNLIYLVQWRYEELAGAWQYYRNKTWGDNSTLRVDNLQPYTKYRFRVAILLSKRHNDIILSAPSVVINTLPSGSPSSPPMALRVTAIDSHRVSLSWEPGPFPNGPILSYVLKISEITPNGYSAIKDLPVTEKSLFYMFQSLLPSRTYKVEVAMRNVIGDGPSATVLVTTPSLPIASGNQQPILILGGEHSVLKQTPDMLSEPITLYHTKEKIQGLGIHVSKSLLFISDSSGSVHKISLDAGNTSKTILTPASINYKPLDLSIDWLNEHIYILGQVNYTSDDKEESSIRWQIIRCDFDGKSQTVAIAGFLYRPVHMEVDPYNGYLFWVQQQNNSGLYRLDLAHISNGVKKEVIPDKILSENYLGAFTVDHTNFRIFVPHLKNNTVLSVSLDGREHVNFRPNTQRPRFESIKFLSFANGIFYWTNGKEIVIEEYHSRQKTYYHNSLPDRKEKCFNSILIFLRSCQPIPIAVNPPIGLQSVMGFNHAKISWQPPHLLGHQGNGAWQQWEYNLQITNTDNNSTIFKIGGATSYDAKDLKENTVYIIRAAAVTSSGVGPWSSEFTAKTLSAPENGGFTSILWSSREGLLRSDFTGDNIQTLIHKSQLGNTFITDISWYKDQLYLVTNTSNVIWYNITSKRRGKMPDMENVGSLAVDWIGNKLYWSNPKQQLITRGNLTGGNRESIPIVTVGKELKIDSLNGFIYWNTGHAIECSRLNGEHKIMYYRPQLFRKQVMGLTVDLKGKLLYWIVHEYEGSKLYNAPTADKISPDYEISGNLISSLSNTATMGPLVYFSDRLFWLQDDSHAVISDVTGHNKANLNSTLKTFINMIAIIDSTLQNIPEDHDLISVIPESFNYSSIKITGEWNEFNISWDPVTQVNHGQIFYEVKMKYNTMLLENTTSVNYIQYSRRDIPPYSSLEVTIRAYTYWGSSPTARINLNSPQTLPSHPNRPRVFVLHQNNPTRFEADVRLAFRWDPPFNENGVIQGYIVDCWYKEDEIENKLCDGEKIPPHQFEYITQNVSRNATFHFQVSGYNDAGIGPSTKYVSALTNIESLIPKLAIAYDDSIKVLDLDLEAKTVSVNTGKLVDFAINLQENLIFWMNSVKEIFVSKFNESDYVKIMTINGTGLSIAVDWVNRLLYWSQTEQNYCAIYELDLNFYEIDHQLKIREILRMESDIISLQVSPLTKSLYWVETGRHRIRKMMKSNVDGFNVKPFFGTYHTVSVNSHKDRKNCNCPENPTVHEKFSLDLTEMNNYKVYWISASTKYISVSDMEGCRCNVIVNTTNHHNKEIFPELMSLDSKFIYWSKAASKSLYYTYKDNNKMNNIHHMNISTGHKILGMESKIQPYPPTICLSPKQIPLKMSVINHSSTTITLKLPEPAKHEHCKRFNMATPYYTVNYKSYIEGEENDCSKTNCSIESTFDKYMYIDRLEPFTDYVFTVQVNNYYGMLRNILPTVGPPLKAATDAKAPTPVKNVKGSVISPNHITVEWSLPENDEIEPMKNRIYYEVHYSTDKASFIQQVKKEDGSLLQKNNILPKHPNANIVKIDLEKLLPSQNYSILIRTCYINSDVHNDSSIIHVKTHPEPNPIKHGFIGPYMMHVSWKPYDEQLTLNYSIEYEKVGSEDWKQVDDEGFEKDDLMIYVLHNLSPKTKYKFRIKMYFVNNTNPYYWPHELPFVFETTSDRPSPPGKPVVQQLSHSVFQLNWKPSDPHGSPITIYRLYGELHSSNNKTNYQKETTNTISRQARTLNLTTSSFEVSEKDNQKLKEIKREGNVPNEDWILLYNGTENYWIITDLKVKSLYIFHVQASNSDGWSDFSDQSEEFQFPETNIAAMNYFEYLLYLSVVAIFIILMVFSFILYKRCMLKNKKAALGQPLPILRGPDVELATLRQLPHILSRGGFFQQSTNILYNNRLCNPTDADIALLPHIRRDQITLTRFLGSGAFGEVFEGKAKELESEKSETRVAIKTLRKGATDQEKTEFLQEAQLMSNFKHEHILRMLGVCLDNDPHFIIMELMEGGDLLSYLRARRPMLYTNDSLTLYDLLSMCRDVTKGCRYLEEMHFVHRDLACRNCLVSQQVNGRVVKIGDFGLARDIYKNDYYRKEGEGLLPVRWMAVECLMDGVFSRASDVWAWAVLCWEVSTLGQQPYSGLLNQNVMRFVRGGGTLNRPPNCPIPLFGLLKKCWAFHPEQRPTFKYCLEVLEELIQSIEEDMSLIAPIDEDPQYITVVPDGHPQTSEPSIQSVVTEQAVPSSVPTENVPIGNPPKYLELVYGGDMPDLQIDGYEVPRSSIRSNTSRKTLSEETCEIIKKLDINTPNEKVFNFIAPVDNNMQTNRLSKISDMSEFISENESDTIKNPQLQKLIPRQVGCNETEQNEISHSSDDEKLSLNSRKDANRLMNGNGFIIKNPNLFSHNSDSIGKTSC